MVNKEIKDLNPMELIVFETIRAQVSPTPLGNTEELIGAITKRTEEIEQDAKKSIALLYQYREAITKLANSKKGIFG